MSILEGKVAIVTGGGGWLGRGITLALAKEGARPAIVDLNPDAANAIAAEVNELGMSALAVPCNVGNEKHVQEMVATAARELGPIDILVNAAQSWGGEKPYLSEWEPLETISEEQWDEVFQTGIKATWYCCKAVLPYMRERGGKVINFGSIAGIDGLAGMSDYAANKEAIRSFTKVAAREWGQYKINVNLISPLAQAKRTEKIKAAYGEGSKEMKEWNKFLNEYVENLPIQRVGDPEKDIGRVAVFLASPDSDYITGHTFMVDGGAHML